MKKLLYKPFAIIAGLISKRLGQSVFKTIWARIDEEPPPLPGTGEGSIAKLVGAQALQGAVAFATAAGVNRTVARLFHHLLGAWPEKRPEPAPEDS